MVLPKLPVDEEDDQSETGPVLFEKVTIGTPRSDPLQASLAQPTDQQDPSTSHPSQQTEKLPHEETNKQPLEEAVKSSLPSSSHELQKEPSD